MRLPGTDEELGKSSLTISRKPVSVAAVSQARIKASDNFGLWAAEREDAGRSIVHADQMRTTFRELQAAIYRQFEPQMEIHAYLHVLLSAQIKIGHATAWMRTRICASFMLRASLLSFGFAPWFARILRETFTEKPNDAPPSLNG